MTVDSFVTSMALEFGEDANDPDTKALMVDLAVEVYEAIVSSGRWFYTNSTESITLVDGQRTYSLPATVAEPRTLRRDSTNAPISYVPVERLVAASEDILGDTGPPTAWYVEGIGASQEMVLGLFPIPGTLDDGDTVTVIVFKRPDALTGSSTIPLPVEYMRLMKDGFRARMRGVEDNPNAAALAEQRFNDGLIIMAQRYGGAPRRGSRLPVKTRLHVNAQANAAVGNPDPTAKG